MTILRSQKFKFDMYKFLLGIIAGILTAFFVNPAHAQSKFIEVPPEAADTFNPFEHPDYWKEVQYSKIYPIAVRYTHIEDSEMATRVLTNLESAWKIQIGQLGFVAPIAADPSGEGKYQVFLIRGIKPAVDVGEAVKGTAYESFMAVNAWGKYAGPALESTMQHEFNHSLQAAYDWEEPGSIFEMSANFIQEKIRPGGNPEYHIEIKDFQSHPEWAVHYNDDYETYFMYGSFIYLKFLEEKYFSKDPQFLANIWKGTTGSPTWIDSLNRLLPKGKTYVDTIVEFARWRFTFPEDGVAIAKEITSDNSGEMISISGTQILGSRYLKIIKGVSDQARIKISSGNWTVQTVDGERLQPQNGDYLLKFGKAKEKILIFTALPATTKVNPSSTRTRALSFQVFY